MKIYTRTGDEGTTSLYTGKRIPKDDPFVEALGNVDEGNSAIGFALSFLPQKKEFNKTREQLIAIQHALFDAGAALATPLTSATEKKLAKTHFDQHAIASLESWIDEMEAQLNPLKHFILPGGHNAGASLHLARSIIRRAERTVIPLYLQGDVNASVMVYLNRLSDYLFVASRYINHILQEPETIWKPAT
ncbi:MAG: cob(I)yrinic acid a,c-diamide adenosyltransferase [Parachlamydiaceae bacterium]|nr:cob(I)yrinic acid a,c-diamide adenosyltransferase [Parachlamydiaceae bacterium]